MLGIFLELQEASVARVKVNEEKVVGDDLRQVGSGVQSHSLSAVVRALAFTPRWEAIRGF